LEIKKGIPIYTTNRLLRWAYVVTSFDFEIKYVKSENNTADFLSRIKISKLKIDNQNPAKFIISPWKCPKKPWTRVRCDFLGPFEYKYFFVIVDATTKWLEVFQINSMTAEVVIQKCSETIARFGILKKLHQTAHYSRH